MAYKKSDEIYIVTTRTGFIPQLNMCGPIPNPIRVPLRLCLSLINSGVKIQQMDPKTRMILPLTLENLYDDQKFEKYKQKNSKPDLGKDVKPNIVSGIKVDTPKTPAFEPDSMMKEPPVVTVEGVKDDKKDETPVTTPETEKKDSEVESEKEAESTVTEETKPANKPSNKKR